ncbi:MAG: hypothetical protein SFY66_07910 [Oculatellaceae cyanobacterium bins.114]|nr:hypothetical protein [Oculatellaceae cyanobacterium bins.114]
MKTGSGQFLILLMLGLLVPMLINRAAMANSTPSNSQSSPERTPSSEMERDRHYQEVIRRTVDMVRDPEATELARRAELDILDVTWEDTGRYYNSAVGPNISDMTIQVQHQNPDTGELRLNLMPVIRHPNFADRTADIPLDRFFLLVGNEQGEDLRRVSLREFLGNMRQYLSEPSSWRGRERSLLADRDTHVLVSAQACFLPVPQAGMAQFNPVLFNYQSSAGNPAVLTILATREGTSVTIIDNQRDAFEAGATWGQRLFFNHNGERASLTGQRISDFRQTEGNDPTAPAPTAAGESGLNMVMLIQVPLRHREPEYRQGAVAADEALMAPPAPMAAASRGGSDVEAAVIGHGDLEGPFTEIAGLPIERDPRFPIRVTVQFYKATSNGVVSPTDIQEIRQQIAKIYDDADYVGSLVVDGASDRPTEYDGSHVEPSDWWQEFWQRYEQNTGRSRTEAIELFRWLRGESDRRSE